MKTWVPRDPEARRLKQRAYALTHAHRKALARSVLVTVSERGRLRLVPVSHLFDLARHPLTPRSAALAQAGAGRARVATIAAVLKQLNQALRAAGNREG